MKKTLCLAICALFIQPVLAQDCDRDCLKNVSTHYLDALVSQDPSLLTLTEEARFTEDHVELELGEGLWQSIDGLGTFRQDVIDVETGTAGVHVTAYENGVRVLVAIRLKVEGGEIAEIDTTVVRNAEEGMIFRPEAVIAASQAMNVIPPADQRTSREDMVRLALLYPEGLRIGSFVEADALFSSDAYRFENGQLMAGPGCTFFPECDNIREQALPTLAGIEAHVAAVDEELGIVWLRMNFGAGSIIRGEGELSVWEMFKIYDGRIQAVEAFMEVIPVGTPFGWNY